MSRVFTAFRAFFASLFDGAAALRIDQALKGQFPVAQQLTATAPKLIEPVRPIPQKPRQSEAITLLATLQREARLVDFFNEDLSQYSDEQIGAAVREIHRDCKSVLDRFFAIRPILDHEEGADVEIPAGFDAARFRLTGKIVNETRLRGTLRHHGWEVTRCELPEFTGNEFAAKTISPAEVEVV